MVAELGERVNPCYALSNFIYFIVRNY